MTSVSGDESEPSPTGQAGDPIVTGTPSPAPRKSWFRWWMIPIIVAVVVAIGWSVTMQKDGDDVASVSTAVATQWRSLPGIDDPTALRYTQCAKGKDDTFVCSYKVNGKDTSITVLWADETQKALVKRIAGGPLGAAGISSDTIAGALAADDKLHGAPGNAYACGTSQSMNPDGTTAAAGATGFLCVLKGAAGGADEPSLRYVQVDSAGDLVRDFVLPGDEPAATTPGT